MSERLEYVQQLETQIAAAKSQLESLKAEKRDALVAVQHEEVEHLEKYLDQAHVSLSGLNSASEDAWHSLKADIDKLLSNLRAIVDKLSVK